MAKMDFYQQVIEWEIHSALNCKRIGFSADISSSKQYV